LIVDCDWRQGAEPSDKYHKEACGADAQVQCRFSSVQERQRAEGDRHAVAAAWAQAERERLSQECLEQQVSPDYLLELWVALHCEALWTQHISNRCKQVLTERTF